MPARKVPASVLIDRHMLLQHWIVKTCDFNFLHSAQSNRSRPLAIEIANMISLPVFAERGNCGR